jgi:oxygen-independent coproporphyrinogen-3 oxidase
VARWRDAGVNRVSLGAQSFDEGVLTWMHRTHDSAAITRAVALLRGGGIENLSLDLIFALPESLKRDFAGDVERLLALEPDHVSLYGLTVETHTPLGHWVERGITREQPEEGYEQDFLHAHQALTAKGFVHYEVSNFGRPGRRSRHNSSYWSGVPYVGLGPAAHGFDGTTRRANLRHYAEWRDVARSNADPLASTELLTDENRVAESVYLGLRTVDGLAFQSSASSVVEPWISAGWVTVDQDGQIRCTADGWLRLDALATALTHHRSR